MENIALIIMLAVTVEALVEYAKSIGQAFRDKQAKMAVTQLCAVAVSIGLCAAAGADLYAAIGVPFTVPWVGRILTGIFASRGANFVSDLVSRLTVQKQE